MIRHFPDPNNIGTDCYMRIDGAYFWPHYNTTSLHIAGQIALLLDISPKDVLITAYRPSGMVYNIVNVDILGKSYEYQIDPDADVAKYIQHELLYENLRSYGEVVMTI